MSYLTLAAFAVGYPFYKRSFDLANSELSGVPAIVVGLPWSLLVIEVVRAALPHFEGIGALLFMTVPGMLLNAFLIYFLFSRAGSTRPGASTEDEPRS